MDTDKNIYDSERHLHLGYYDLGNDIEAIAFNKLGTDLWDVYFSQFYDVFESEQLFKRYPKSSDDTFGVLILSCKGEAVEKEFREWVETYLIPSRQNVK